MGVDCDPSRCGCVGCLNDGKCPDTLAKRIAYQTMRLTKQRSCRCSKNKCQQKYCPCFLAGVKCGTQC